MHCKYIILKGSGLIYPPILKHAFCNKIFQVCDAMHSDKYMFLAFN